MAEEIPSPNPVRFIEDALFCTSPLALSYSDPDQKWIIRKHLISLFQEFTYLKPSISFFTHNDGTEVRLLKASGEIRISGSAPNVPITIWVHELYPQMAPIVYVDPTKSLYPIHEIHPFVDSCSGSTLSTYLINWQYPRSNLSDLVQNLTKLLSLNHPFFYPGLPKPTRNPSMASKMEAIDRLTCMIYYDMKPVISETEEEMEKLSAVKAELERRASVSKNLILGLEKEKRFLKERVLKLNEETDKVSEWLKLYDKNRVVSLDEIGIDHAFGALDKKSEVLVELKSGDDGLEDLMYAFEKAVEEGVVSCEFYVKQVRVLAREQFWHRAKIVKVEKQNRKFKFV